MLTIYIKRLSLPLPCLNYYYSLIVFYSGVSLEKQAELITNQVFHIEQQLKLSGRGSNESVNTGSDPSFLIVAGHYPVFSTGSKSDSYELRQYLQPLMEKYGVDVYICGHDHVSEHLV